MNQVYRDIEEFIPDMRRYARYLAHNSVAADDLVQDALTRALAKAHLFRPGTNLRAWLFTILHNQYISDIRRQSRAGVPVDPDDVAHALATQPGQNGRLLVRSLSKAMQRLPRQQRALIQMVALQGRSYEEAAEATSLPVGTVKSRISRGRRQLRRMLDGRPVNGRRAAA
jgi:RNA polymerase sigma-70 factor (ECF subfamily)